MTPPPYSDSLELSLFDPENLHELELLRSNLAQKTPAPSDLHVDPTRVIPIEPTGGASVADNGSANGAGSNRVATDASQTDAIFERFKIAADDDEWHMGSVDIDIVHRGKMRISTRDWPPLIMYCKHDAAEDGIGKQFRLHVLQYAADVRLVYGTYRFKQRLAKMWMRDYRCGKLIDAQANVRESMINLAYWLTAQPYAEKNYATWETLIDEALTKLQAVQ